MSISDNILIDKYFRHELTAEEKKLFEQRKSNDPSFLEEVQMYEQALQIIQQEGHHMLKQRLTAIGKSTDRNKRIVKWLAVIMTGIIIILLFTVIKHNPVKPDEERKMINSGTQADTSNSKIKTDSLNLEKMDQAEELKNRTPSSQSTKSESIEKQSSESLFADNFTPYTDESLQSGLRGQNSLSASDKFIEAYLKGNYMEALSLFEKMDFYDRKNDNMLFIQALCLIHTGEDSRGINLLEQIINRDQTRFMSASNWYLALMYIKTGNIEKAKSYLNLLRLDTIGGYSKKANTLLKEF
ncbi:MAG: CDC27 family protein [Bacteroidota bacterium]|nr:CDC27 family protein [Bacteroidota bacterium]